MSIDFGPFVLGGNVFGWTASREESFRVLDAFVAQGGTSIDTADSYTAWVPGNKGGESEAIIGEWVALRKNRASVKLATKVAKWSARPGLSAGNIRAAVEGSLRRLQTDYIDLYYAHEDDEKVEQIEYLQAFDALVREGKVRALGVSNFTPARIVSALELAKQSGLRSFEISQDHWSLVERSIERDLVPVLEAHGLRELPYWALAKGFLTGKYRPGKSIESSRAQAAGAYLKEPQNVALLGKLDALAAAHGVSVAAIALAWVRQQRVVAAPLASARTVEQLALLFESAKVTLSGDELTALSAITAKSASGALDSSPLTCIRHMADSSPPSSGPTGTPFASPTSLGCTAAPRTQSPGAAARDRCPRAGRDHLRWPSSRAGRAQCR